MRDMIQFAFALAALALCSVHTGAQTDTTFTYQGELKDGGGPANGSYNLDFSLWDAASAGGQIGSTIMFNSLPVTDGRFTVELDFGAGAFDNGARWLQISVNGTELMPRHPVTRSPYSIQTRGIFVDENENVGIGTTTPATALHVSGTGPSVRIEDDNGSGSHTLMRDFDAFTTLFEKTSPNGSAAMNFSPKPLNGVSAGTVGLFRHTSTSGNKQMLVHRGDGTSGVSAAIGAGGRDSYFQLDGGNVGIGTNAPETALDVVGDSKFRKRLGVGNQSAFFGQLSIADSGDGSIFAIDANSSNDAFPTIFASNTGGGPVLWVQGTSNVWPEGGGLIVAGDESAKNLAIDNNEIMARDDGLPSDLFLNASGGNIYLGPGFIRPALAYGKVVGAGPVVSESSNITLITRVDAGRYNIEIEGGVSDGDIVVVTAGSSLFNAAANVDVVNDHYNIILRYLSDLSYADVDFQFVVYRP